MKKIVMIFAAMAAVLSSCSKSELESVSANEIKDIVLNISVGNPGADDTKALVKTGWVDGDQIKIWFDTNKGETPDLVIKYDGSNWTQVGNLASTPSSSGHIKAVYNNFVIVASKDNYTYTDNTLSFHIENWKFLTEIQVVVKGIPYYYDATYKLSCDKFTPVTRAGFTVGVSGITAAMATKGGAVKGISNADGVAFVFATADYSKKKDFTFTLTDDITGSEVTKVYTAVNTAIEAKPNKSSIKALTIDISKFAATTGSAKRTGDIGVNWVQLWAGGPKFAEYNVGAANSKAEDYGGYYAWGGRQDMVDDHNTGDNVLSGDNDTATKLWGSNWRMPTEEELTALKNDVNCTCTWTEGYNGSDVNGWLCTGKGAYSSNSIFVPAAGYFTGAIIKNDKTDGNYWSSTPNLNYDNYSFKLTFASDGIRIDSASRKSGNSVRAVLAE